mmetsp:Transcript_24376/g.21560  ORF Transcript_24376/g.21560 Transcript_24376/m.21560 type:complete len:111 (-) Transcript_24376:185-517(-)
MSGILPDPRKNHLSLSELQQVEDEITKNIFKGQENISYSRLTNLRDLIYQEIYQFEFGSFERNENGTISQEDFAKSIVCYLKPSVVNKYWKHLDGVEFKGDVTLDQYKSF